MDVCTSIYIGPCICILPLSCWLIYFLLKAMDNHRADLSGAFFIGQSVRSNILDVSEIFETEFFNSNGSNWHGSESLLYHPTLFFHCFLQVNNETERITVSLKQSCCSSTDASFIQEYFILEEKVYLLSNSLFSPFGWFDAFYLLIPSEAAL